MKPSKSFFRFIAMGATALLLCSCGAAGKYSDKIATVETHLLNQQFERASAEIDQNKFLAKDRNRLLYLMEKGKMEHLNGNYEESNRLLEEAYIMIDDRIRNNAGQAIASKLTNPMATPYKGEDFEKVTLHYYKALNFFQLGDPAAALVEAKRINIKLNELNSRYKKNKNKYTEDAFSEILQGLLYEARGDINNAFIAYRNAADIYLENEGSYFGVPMPEQLKKDLLRTAKTMGFHNEYKLYSEKFDLPGKTPKGQPEAEAIVFWENGLGPEKDQTIITASGMGGWFVGTYGDGDIIIPIPPGVNIGINALAIPKYAQRNPYYHSAEIIVNGTEKEFDLAQDYYSIAKQCLRDRMMREVVDMATRFVVKKGVSKGLGFLTKQLTGSDLAGDLVELGADAAGAATEKADTRNWQTLPATISYARVPLEENSENVFIIKKHGSSSVDYDTLRIAYKKGLQLVNYFDLGRTTTGYVIPEKIHADADPTLASSAGGTSSAPGMKSLKNSMGLLAGSYSTTGGTALAETEKTHSPLVDAITEKNLEKVSKLINEGADVNEKGATNYGKADNPEFMVTPLFLATLYGETEMVEKLVAKGADPNVPSTVAQMLPITAVGYLTPTETMAKPILKALLGAGADINAQEGFAKTTALHKAATTGKAETVLLLIEHGADVNMRNSAGQTPLEWVQYFKNIAIKNPELYPDGYIDKLQGIENVLSGINSGDKVNKNVNDAYGNTVYAKMLSGEQMGNSAKVIIIREKRGAGKNQDMPIFFNGQFSFDIKNKSYKSLYFTAGKLLMETKNHGGVEWKTGSLELYLSAGQTYYVQLRFDSNSGPDGADYRVINEESGLKYMENYEESPL